jgi:hypothetical protein
LFLVLVELRNPKTNPETPMSLKFEIRNSKSEISEFFISKSFLGLIITKTGISISLINFSVSFKSGVVPPEEKSAQNSILSAPAFAAIIADS